MDNLFEHLETSFDEALQRYIQTDPNELGKEEKSSIKEDKLDNLMPTFEANAHFEQIAPEDLSSAPNVKYIQKDLPKVKAVAKITIDISNDLWKYAMLVMVSKPAGIMMTTDLIKELPKYIEVPVNTTNTSAMRKESRFPQLVRNLKSNKKNKTNFINEGYVQDIKGGFQITLKGLNFVKEYFKDRIEF